MCGPWSNMQRFFLHSSSITNREKTKSIGVIVPAHNASITIVSTIDSILSSITPGDEVFVIENGSTDDTWQKLKQNYSRISAVRLIQSAVANASIARNIGVASAHDHEYVAFCDADDIWFPQKIELVKQIIEIESPDILFHPMLSVGEGRLTLEAAGFLNKDLPCTQKFAWDMALKGNFLPTSALVLQRKLLATPPFLPDLKQTQDFEAWCAMSCGRNTLKVAYLDSILGIHRWMRGLSKSIPSRMRNVWSISTSYIGDAPFIFRLTTKLRMISHILWWLGKTRNLRSLGYVFSDPINLCEMRSKPFGS